MNTRHIYEVCKPVNIFGGVYAKDTYIKTVKQEKLYVVNTDPSWAPGEDWFVVGHTQEPCVVFDSYGTLRPSSSSAFWQGALGAAYFLTMLYRDQQQMCVVTTVFFMFFLCAAGRAPRSCFSLLSKLGDSTHDRDHTVREMCLSTFGAFNDNGVHVSSLLNQICMASFYTLI